MTTRPTPCPALPQTPHPPVLRLRDPAGVVAAVPYLLGFVPRRSLVVVGVDEGQGVGATLRVDLPTDDLLGAGACEVLPVAWAHVGRVLRRNGCGRALVVLYGDVDPADLPDEAVRRLLDVLETPAVSRSDHDEDHDPDHDHRDDADHDPGGVLVLDVLLVGPCRFRSLLCPDRACCPVEGVLVSASGSHPVAASFVLAGRSVVGGREEVEPVPPVADEADRVAAATAAQRSCRARPHGAAAADHDRRLLREWVACLPGGPSPRLVGRLASRWRANPLLRDACLAVFLPGGPDLARHLLAGANPSAPSLAGSLVDPGCAGAVHTGAPVLRRMAALVPAPLSAEVLAAHAWLSWASGEGTAAMVLAERALVVAPTHSLARLVLQCLDHGLGAPWTAGPARTAAGGSPRRRATGP